MDKYDFGNRLYEYRTQKGLTQKELGKLLGVTDKAVSKWETGESKPRLDKMKQITELFETSIDGMLGEEMSSNGEVLKPYKTIFDLNLEKKNKYYKASRIITYIVGLLFIVSSVVVQLSGLANSGAMMVDLINLIETIVLTSVTFILTLNIKNKFDENPERYIKKTTIVSFLLFTVAGILSSINYYLLYRFVEDPDYFELIICGMAWVVAFVMFFITMMLKKRYQILCGLVVGFSIGILLNTNFSLFVMPMMMGVQMAFLTEKYNWLKLAQKAEIDYKSEEKKHTKLVRVFTILISIAIVISLLLSWLSPYLAYRACLRMTFPNGYNVNRLEYKYNISFDTEYQTIDCANVTCKIPNGYEKVDIGDETNYVFKDKTNLISFYYTPKEEVLDYNLNPEDFAETTDLKDVEAKLKYYYYNMRKYFGEDTSTFYGTLYLYNIADLSDVKFYETQKAMMAISLLFMSSVANQTDNERSVMHFDDGEKCGFIVSHYMNTTDEGKQTIGYVGYAWKSNDKDGAYYQINYICRDANDDSIYTLCKIINSMEF